MNIDYPGKYYPRSIPSYETLSIKSESSHGSQSEVLITRDMVMNLVCEEELCNNESHIILNAPTPPVSEAGDIERTSMMAESMNFDDQTSEAAYRPQLMIVYAEGDINSSLQLLMDSLQRPFASNAVAMLLVEQPIYEQFVQLVRERMRPLSMVVTMNPLFSDTLLQLEQQGIEIIRADKQQVAPPLASPILACNCYHTQLAQPPNGVICLHSFRSTVEAIELARQETRLRFNSVSIWDETLAGNFQLLAALKCNLYYFNCSNVPLQHFQKQQHSVCVSNGFHFELLELNNRRYIIVMPIGAFMPQKLDDDRKSLTLSEDLQA
ncbi:uncharacterized protein LOC108596039 [Drosophila busckii]|uniref:uncharacterized protein LOC108596039 n=1 Tax=Drosophila busckii TaxID=30019 RepID=UPI00083ED233|nr:uncharacterized protein LOC108596039 [Drosophila busckii]